MPVCCPKVLSANLNVNSFGNFGFTLTACAGKLIYFPKQVNKTVPGRMVFRMPSALWPPAADLLLCCLESSKLQVTVLLSKEKTTSVHTCCLFCHGTHGFCFYHGWPVQWVGEKQCPFSKCQWNRGGCCRLST